MAAIKVVYVGGGSTRAPGTMASFIKNGSAFAGSEFVLVDLNAERLELCTRLSRRMAEAEGVDISISWTLDRKEALAGADVVLTSFRPGGFEARYLDESIPLKHGVIGQETQGPGGFFMALRSIAVMKDIVADMEEQCPDALLVNYTNPINIVSQALTRHTSVRMVSLCEGPIIFSREIVETAGLDVSKLQATMIGVNHACWSIQHLYDGEDLMPILARRLDELQEQPDYDPRRLRMVRLAVAMGSLPASYYQYYFFKDEILAELKAKSTTRAQDILAHVPDFWKHYAEQAEVEHPHLDPDLSRGGITELELAVDVIDAYVNDRHEVWPVNVVNNGALPDFPDDFVVEVPAMVARGMIEPQSSGHLPSQTLPLVKALAEYQSLAADVAWSGTREDGIRALASHPLVMSLDNATVIYDEMATAHQAYLPERLWAKGATS